MRHYTDLGRLLSYVVVVWTVGALIAGGFDSWGLAYVWGSGAFVAALIQYQWCRA